MFRKNYSTLLLIVALLLTGGAAAAFAQTAPVLGRVEMKKADGSVVPVAGAVVDVYRTDVKGKLPSGKTNGKGEFSFAGFPLGGQYVLAVSAAGAQPDTLRGVRAGSEKLVISLIEGDGKRFTEEEVRSASAASAASTATTGGTTAPRELTAEEKKAKEEYDKKFAEATANNKKIEQSTAIITRVVKEGTEAFTNKNYDLAIAKFDEGINADPDFAGSAPTLLNNKTSALLNRATLRYNAGVKADEATKTAAIAAVKKDLEDAEAASVRALTILKGAPAAEDANVQKNYDANKMLAISNRKEVYRLMSRTGANRSKGKEALAAFQEYFAVETDAKKKSDSQLILAELLQDSSEFDLAISEFEKVLTDNPESVDALAGAGFSLVNVGYINNDKTKLQQGANYLQKFADLAPDTHRYKNDAKGLIETLKKEQNVAPVKGAKGATKKKS